VPARRPTTRTLPWWSQSGRRPVRGDDAPGPVARPPASRSCGLARRPGPRRPAGGCAPGPGRARALGHGHCRPRYQPGPLVLGAVPHAPMVSAAAGPGRLGQCRRRGSAIAGADRRPGLGLAGRRGSARRAGSDGSSRSTGRRPGRPRRWSGSAVAGGGHRPGAERSSPRCAYPKFVTACDAASSPPCRAGGRVAVRLDAVTGRAPPTFLRRPGAWPCEPPRGREGNWQGRRRRWPPSVAYARLSPRWIVLGHVAEPLRFCRRSAQPVRTSPDGRGSPRTESPPACLLSRTDAPQADDPGRTRMRPTRLKTARSAVRSRPCPPPKVNRPDRRAGAGPRCRRGRAGPGAAGRSGCTRRGRPAGAGPARASPAPTGAA